MGRGDTVTIQQMEYFLSTASLLSFNKAAKVHYTSPSTITRQIATLEAELGVKLLERDTHRVSVTEAGKLFFLRVQSIIGEVSQYRDDLIAMRFLPPDGRPFFRIASYTSDSMYRYLVDLLQDFPADWLSKPYKFIFPREGQMLEALREGAAQVGIDSAETMAQFADEFDTHPLHESPFRLLVGRSHPLYKRRSIGVEELLRRYGHYGDYIPASVGALSVRSKAVTSAEELRVLGEYTITLLPRIIPLLGRGGRATAPMDGMMLLVPKALELFDFVHFHSIELRGEDITTQYVLFWPKGGMDADIEKLLEMVDYGRGREI